MDENGNEINEIGKEGEVVIKLPGPLTLFKGYWKDNESCIAKYYTHFPGYFRIGDVGKWEDYKCFHMLRRVDEDIFIDNNRVNARWL